MEVVEWLLSVLIGVGVFALGIHWSPDIKCTSTSMKTAEYLHTRMCDANNWKDCQPWVREDANMKERYMNLAKDVCK